MEETNQNIVNLNNASISKFETRKDLKINNITDDFDKWFNQFQQQMALLEIKADRDRKFKILLNKINELTKLVDDIHAEMRASKFYSAP